MDKTGVEKMSNCYKVNGDKDCEGNTQEAEKKKNRNWGQGTTLPQRYSKCDL